MNTRERTLKRNKKTLVPGTVRRNKQHADRRMCAHTPLGASGGRAGRLRARSIIHAAGRGLLIKFWWPERKVIVLFRWKAINQKLNTSTLMPLHPLWIVTDNGAHYTAFKYVFASCGRRWFLFTIGRACNATGCKRSAVSQAFTV